MTERAKAAAIAWRYAFAALCVAGAVLLHESPVGPVFHPMGLFILAVVAAGWVGGAGAGLFAAFLSAIALPHLIAITYPLSLDYPLLAGFFDVPRFITLGMTGAAVGWGTSSLRRAQRTLRERERELTEARDELETAVAVRTANLAESEERYARAMEATAAGHWEWDLVTHQVFHSPRFRELYAVGLDEQFADREAWKARQPLSAAERERQEQALQASIADPNKPYDIELSFEVRPGEVRWLRSRGKVFRDDYGRPLRISGTTTDITAQKLGQEALRRSEERYARVMLAAKAGFWDWDVLNDQFYTSPRLLEMCGFPPGTTFSGRAEFMQRAPFFPGDRDRYQEAVKRLFASDGSRLTMEVRSTVHGATVWNRLDGICFRDETGRVVRWTGSATDITEQERAEEALRQSEQRYARVMQASEDGFWEWIVAGDQFYASPRMLAIYGLPPDTVFRGRADFLSRFPFHGEDLELWRASVAAHLAGVTARIDIEIRNNVRGKTRWIHLTGICQRDASGAEERWTGSVSDVTDRHRAQEALSSSEERYARAMEGSDAGHWDWNIVTDEMFVSERAREMLALPADGLPARRSEIMALVPMHPEDRARMAEVVAAGIRTGVHERDYRVIPRPGEMRWLRTRAKVYRDARGTAVRMTGSLIDITERKLAAEALRLSEQRYARAMDATEAGHWEWNVATDEVFVSASQREMLELPPQLQFANREAYLCAIPFHPEDRERFVALAKRHIDEVWPRFQQEFRVIVKGGETRWMRLAGKSHLGTDGKPTHFTGSLIDVTDAKLAADALRLSEERYALALQVAEEGHWDWNVRTDEIFDSNQALRMLGLPPDTQYRTRADLMARVRFHPDDWPRISAEWREALAGRGADHEFEYRILRGEEPRSIRSRWKIFRDAHGAAERVIGVLADITERKLAEEALLLSEERYALAMRASDAGHWDWKIAEDEFYASPRYLEFGGFPPDLQYSTRDDIVSRIPFHPDDRPAYEAAVLAHFAGETPRLDVVIRVVPHGQVRWLHVIGMCLRDEHGKPVRWAGSVADITERKHAEEALRASEERYGLAIEASDQGFVDANIETDEFITSDRLNEIFGIEPGARFKDRRDFLSRFRFFGDDARLYRDQIGAVTAKGGPERYEFDFRIVTASGEVRWLWTRGVVTRDADGRARRRIGVVADITARKRAEEGLRRSEQRYALAMEAAGDGHTDWNLVTGESYISPRMLKMLGYPAETTFTDRADWVRRFPFHPDDRKRWEAAIAAHFAGREAKFKMDLRIVVNGETRWVAFTFIATRDAAGNVVRWTGSIADIDDAKRDLATMLNAIPGMVAILSPAAEVDAVNNELMAYLGQPLEVIKQWGTNGIVHPEDVPHAAAVLGQAMQTGQPYDVEVRARRFDGVYRWIYSRALPVRDLSGGILRWFTIISDIDDRKRAEEALRVSEERYALAMEASEEGHLDWNVQTDEMFASAHLKRVLHLRADVEYGTRGEAVADIPFYPGDHARVAQMTREVLAGSALQHEFEYRLLLGEAKEPRWIRARWKIFRDADGTAQRVIGVVSDITERKVAEDELRESEARFRGLTDLWSDWYWRQDENLRFRYSSAGAQWPGGQPRNSAIGLTRWEIPGIVPLSSSWAEHRELLEARKPFRDFEYSRPGGDGTTRYVSSSGTPVFDENGEFRGYQGVARDITETKRFDEELRSRKEMLELALKSARAVPWQWINGADPQVNRWSPELAAMFGVQPSAFDGTAAGWWSFCHPDDLPRIKASIAHTFATGEIDVEYRVAHPDGKLRWLNQKGRAFFDAAGRPVRSLGFMFDVTERRKVEDDLRSRQEMLELAQKAARAIAFEWKIGEGEGENRWSSDLEAMYGFAPGTYDGSFETWKKVVHPDDWPRVKEAIKHAQRTGEVASEYRVVHPDGAVHWLQARGRMFFDAAGSPARMVGFMQDVTQRKHNEVELRQLEQKLRRAQRLEGMGTLAGGIAHDFNNILGAIVGYGEMALRDAKKGTRLRRDLDAIMAAGERGRSLVDRILAFSRSGVGERVPVNVEEVVREALDQLAAKLPENITLAPRLRAGRAAMLGDSTQVHQVVMNLANNAVQAMPKGGVVRVSLELVAISAPRTALIGSLAPGEYLVLRVADTGSGIAPDVLERMFDPFFTTKEVGVGSGLGLSLVHGIVVSVGGAIDVATELGKGSTFTVYLPRSGDAPAATVDENRPLPRGEGQRVLVVDDEEPLVRLATETLERLGYEPIGFTSSTAALAAFRADPQRFDALLTDERMPGMSGSALIREVRGIRDALPVVLMSGYLGMQSVDANVVVRKPVSARELAASMARALHP